MKQAFIARRMPLWVHHPSLCILVLSFLLFLFAGIGLAAQRQLPEVTLTDLQGDPTLLDEFPLVFWLVDTAEPAQHYAAQQYTLEAHGLSCRTGWLSSAEVTVLFSNFTPAASAIGKIQQTQPLAVFQKGGHLLSIAPSAQQPYSLPDESSDPIRLDMGYFLTIYEQNSADILYRGRLNTWNGDDAKQGFGSMYAPGHAVPPSDTSSSTQRQLIGFCLKGVST